MQKSSKHLLLLISTSLIGIIILQAYYSYSDFIMKSQDLEKDINSIFKQSLEEEIALRKEKILAKFRVKLSDSNRIKLWADYNEEKEKTIYHVRDIIGDSLGRGSSVSFVDDKRVIDSLDSENREITIDFFMNSVSNYLDEKSIYYWTQSLGDYLSLLADSSLLDSTKFHQIFQKKLLSEHIQSSFKLIISEQDRVAEKSEAGFIIQTKVLKTDIHQNKYGLQALFPNPFLDLLRRARWGLIGSLGIIFLTSISFWMMMHTIKKQKKLSQIKDDFIDNISHELQTPISILKVALEGLEKYRALEDPQKTKTYLNLSQSELQRLSLLVNQVLKSSIYENSHPNLSRENIDLKEMLDNLAFIYSLKSEKPLFIDYAIPEEVPQIQSNALALRQILENIIDNAIKYNHQPQVNLQITIEHPQEDLIISLRDNGPGISPNEQKKIFEKFYRVSQNDDHSVKGFGIGLYYVKQLIENMGGQISVASKLGEGSTFILHFKEIPYAIQ